MNMHVFTLSLCLYGHVEFSSIATLQGAWQILPPLRRKYLITFDWASVRNVELCCGV